MGPVRTHNALTAYAVLRCLSLLLRCEPSFSQLDVATQQNVDFHVPKTLTQYEVAQQGTGCLWLDSMANGKKYTWRIQPKVYVADMHNAELVVKIASITGGDAVWARVATTDNIGGTLRAYACGGRSLVTNCAVSSQVELPLRNSTKGFPAVGSYFVSPTNELVLEYQAGSEAQNGALGNGFTAIWYSRSHCAEGEFVEPGNLLGECAPGGLYRLSTRARPACSVAYAAGNPGLEGCDLAGYSECPEGAIHDGKCWAITTQANYWAVHDRYCREWGGVLAAINNRDDHMMYARMTSMASKLTLRDVSQGHYALLWTGICKVRTGDDLASFGACDGSSNSTYVTENPSIWWASPLWNYEYVRYLRHAVNTLPLGQFQGQPNGYTSMGMCARPMPQEMICEGATCFKRFSPATYAAAQQTCRNWGGHLAITKTALEIENVRKLGYGQHAPVAGVAANQFPAGTSAVYFQDELIYWLWIGLNDIRSEGVWSWEDGSNHTDGGFWFLPAQRSNGNLHLDSASADCVAALISSSNKYSEFPCDLVAPFACSKPSTAQCLSCPTGSVYDINALECVCTAGYTRVSGSRSCEPCPAGTWKDATGNGACASCPPFSTSQAGSDSIGRCKCIAGHSGWNTVAQGSCSPCPGGTYRSYNASDPSPFHRCLVDGCPSSSYAIGKPILTSASAPLAGGVTFCTGVLQATRVGCLAIGAKKSFWEAKALCEGQGRRMCRREELQHQTASGSCGGGCNYDAELVWADLDTSAPCTACPQHATSPAGSQVVRECECDKGYTGSRNQCTSCTAGYYKNTVGSQACTACVGGKNSAAVAATNASTCADCLADTYSAADRSQCLACPANTRSEIASDELSDCTCKAGYTGADGPCTRCPAGTYKATNGSSACVLCVAGQYSNATAATTCHACPENANSLQGWSGCKCNAGYDGVPDSGNCTACRMGTAKSHFGSGACVECAVGNFSNHTAATACMECTVSTFTNTSGSTTCTSCPAGFYSTKGSSNCSRCPNTTPEPAGCPMIDNEQIELAEKAATAVTAAASVAIAASAACYAVHYMTNTAEGTASCGGIMLLMEQAQFLTIVGSVGGNSAIRANKVFSQGLKWSNFALLDLQDGSSASRRRSAQDGRTPVSSYMCGSSEWDAVVIDFLARVVVFIVALLLVFLIRSGIRQYLILRNPDALPPPYLQFPAWEGPVLLVQFLGWADTLSAMLLVPCMHLKIVGWIVFLMVPVGFLLFSTMAVWSLVSTKELVYSSWGGRWLKGGWRKCSTDAKFWGFLVSSLHASFWGVASWLLLKKICLALTKNMLHGMANAILNIVIYLLDLCMFLFTWPLALTVFNLVQSLCATLNLVAIVTAAVPTMSSERNAKLETLGPVVMWISICSLTVLILLTLLGTMRALYCALVRKRGRLQNVDVLNQNFEVVEQESGGPVISNPDQKKDAKHITKVLVLGENINRERYLVLRADMLMVVRSEHLGLDEFDQYDVSNLPCDRSWSCRTSTVNEFQSSTDSPMDTRARHGFEIVNNDGKSCIFLFNLESTKNMWLSKIKQLKTKFKNFPDANQVIRADQKDSSSDNNGDTETSEAADTVDTSGVAVSTPMPALYTPHMGTGCVFPVPRLIEPIPKPNTWTQIGRQGSTVSADVIPWSNGDMVQVWRPLHEKDPSSKASASDSSHTNAMTRTQARMEPSALSSGTRSRDLVSMTSDASDALLTPARTMERQESESSNVSTSRAQGRSAGKFGKPSQEAEEHIARLKKKLEKSERKEQKMQTELQAQEIELLTEEITKSRTRRHQLQTRLQDAASRQQRYPGALLGKLNLSAIGTKQDTDRGAPVSPRGYYESPSTSTPRNIARAARGSLTDRPGVLDVQQGGWNTDRPRNEQIIRTVGARLDVGGVTPVSPRGYYESPSTSTPRNNVRAAGGALADNSGVIRAQQSGWYSDRPVMSTWA